MLFFGDPIRTCNTPYFSSFERLSSKADIVMTLAALIGTIKIQQFFLIQKSKRYALYYKSYQGSMKYKPDHLFFISSAGRWCCLIALDF